jgi:hypothetical protein
MTTSDASWSASFRKITDLERPDHYYLTPNDDCYFLGEYTAREDHSHSTTNQIIKNLKKKPSTRGTGQWWHKENDMRRVATIMRSALVQNIIPSLTFVPVPPSKLATDPEYDDRMLQISRQISPNGTRELLKATSSRETRHIGSNKRDPAELRATLAIDARYVSPTPSHIILIDDVVTTGCSFMVCKRLLIDHFPDVRVSGMFVARRALPASESLFNLFE